MTRRRRFRLGLGVALGPAVLAACSLLMTEPAPASSDIEIRFQLDPTPLGGTAAAFSRVRRVGLRLTRPDQTSRDTILAALPVDGVIRTGLSLPTDERIDGLGIQAQLGVGTTALFQGGALVAVVPGEPTTVEIPLAPVPDRVAADRPSLTLLGPAATAQLASAVLYATGDTIESLQAVWTSEDATIAVVTPTGLVTALRVGQTRMEARLDTLADTVLVDVQPPPRAFKQWAGAAGGSWGTGANWAGGIPPIAGDTVEITLDGTYTIDMDVFPPTLAALTIAGASGAQTLSIDGFDLAVSGDVTIGGAGSLELAAGTLTSPAVAVGPTSTLRLANGGTVAGPVALAGTLLADDRAGALTGALTTAGTSTIRIGGLAAGDLTVPAGFVSNGTIELRGGGRLVVTSGTLVNAAGATLARSAAGGATAYLTAELENRGTVTLDGLLAIDAAGASHVNSGTITGSGAAFVTVTGADGFANSGSLSLAASSTFTFTGAGPGLVTSGPIAVPGGVQHDVLNGPFVQTGGTLAGGGVLRLYDLSASQSAAMTLGSDGPTFFQLIRSTLTTPGLTTSPSTQLLLQDGTVDGPLVNQGNTAVIGASSSAVTRGVTSAAGSQIEIEGSSLGSPLLTVAGGLSTNGTLFLTNSQAGATARLEVTGGPLTNGSSGVVASGAGAGGGQRVIIANLDNQGFVQPGYELLLDRVAGSHTNTGTITTVSGGPFVVLGASDFLNGGQMFAEAADIDLGFTGSGGGFTNDATVAVQSGFAFFVRNGPFAWTGGGFGGAGILQLVDLAGSFVAPMALGTTGPSQLALTNSTLTAAPGVTTGPGTTLTLNGSTLAGPFASQGLLRAVGNATSSITGAITTATTSEIRVEATGGGTTRLSVAAGFTNDGDVVLTNGEAGNNAQLDIGNGTLAIGATGSLTTLPGAGGGFRVINGSVSNIGTFSIGQQTTINGQLVDPIGAPSAYNGNGTTLAVQGLDVDGAVFDNLALLSSGGTLTRFDNVTFRSLDPTSFQLQIDHPGLAAPFLMSGLTFSTAPTSGQYMIVSDLDAVAPFLTVEVIGSTPASGSALSLALNGALLIW